MESNEISSRTFGAFFVLLARATPEGAGAVLLVVFGGYWSLRKNHQPIIW